MNESGIISWEICQLVRFGLFSDEQAVLRSALRALFQSQLQIAHSCLYCRRNQSG